MEIIYKLEDISKIAVLIIQNCKHKTILFNGEMGAGKTTLISNILNVLNCKDQVSSPTFSIINQYEIENQEVVNHFDFYRLNSEHQALDIGVEEYFYSNNYNFVEWSEKIPNLLPQNYSIISIEKIDELTRKLIISHHN